MATQWLHGNIAKEYCYQYSSYRCLLALGYTDFMLNPSTGFSVRQHAHFTVLNIVARINTNQRLTSDELDK